jgi:predicted GNAT family acetyltransferase
MSSDFNDSAVEKNENQQRYEVKGNGEVAELTYERGDGSITFLHTSVPPALEGHGIGNKLARFALDEARAQGLRVIPLCPFVASFIRSHQEYLPLLPEAEQRRLLRG